MSRRVKRTLEMYAITDAKYVEQNIGNDKTKAFCKKKSIISLKEYKVKKSIDINTQWIEDNNHRTSKMLKMFDFKTKIITKVILINNRVFQIPLNILLVVSKIIQVMKIRDL